jgi:hypothetical protein
MECKQCHGTMMPETVITLRRGLFGLRESRAQGGYCPCCQVGVVVSAPALAVGRGRRTVWQVGWSRPVGKRHAAGERRADFADRDMAALRA